MLIKHIRFGAAPAGEPVVAAFDYLKQNYHRRQFDDSVPMLVVNKAWQRYVVSDAKDKTIDPRAYTFCVLDRLRIALKHRDVFVTPSWRYADPRRGMLAGSAWESTRTGFTDAFSHVSEQSARAAGLSTSLCAVLLAEACNTGIEPLIVGDVAAL